MTSSELAQIIRGFGVATDGGQIADAKYVFPDRKWIGGEFSKSWAGLKRSLSIDRYEDEKGDCDDFGRGAAWWAGICHRRTVGHEGFGLGFGEFWYFRDSGGLHAINFSLEKAPPNGYRFVFFEPQTDRIVELTQKEIESCLNYRI